MDSIETKINQMKVAFQEFYTSTGVQNLIKGVIDFITQLINRFNDFSKMWDKFPARALAIVGGLITSIKSSSSILLDVLVGKTNQLKNVIIQAMKEAGIQGGKGIEDGISNGMANAGKKSSKVSTIASVLSIAGSGLQMYGLSAKNEKTAGWLTGIGGTVSKVGTGVAMGASAGPWGMAIGAIIGLLTSIPDWLAAADLIREKAETAAEKLERLEDELKTEEQEALIAKGELDSLTSYREKLLAAKDAQYESAEARQVYLDLSNEIAAKFPSLIAGYDAEGNAVISLAEDYQTLLGAKTAVYQKELTEQQDAEMKIWDDRAAAAAKVAEQRGIFTKQKKLYGTDGLDYNEATTNWALHVGAEALTESTKDFSEAISSAAIREIDNAKYDQAASKYIISALGIPNFMEQLAPQLKENFDASKAEVKNYGQDIETGSQDFRLGSSKVWSKLSTELLNVEGIIEYLAQAMEDGFIGAEITMPGSSIFYKEAVERSDYYSDYKNLYDSDYTFSYDLAEEFLLWAEERKIIEEQILKQAQNSQKKYAQNMAQASAAMYDTEYNLVQEGIWGEIFTERYQDYLDQASNTEDGLIDGKTPAQKLNEDATALSVQVTNFLSNYAIPISKANDYLKNLSTLSQLEVDTYLSTFKDENGEFTELGTYLNNIVQSQLQDFKTTKSLMENAFGTELEGLVNRIDTAFIGTFHKQLSHYKKLIDNVETKEKGGKAWDAYLNLIDLITTLDEETQTKAYAILQNGDITTLTGLYSIVGELTKLDSTVFGEDGAGGKTLAAILENHVFNLETEWATYKDKVAQNLTTLEDKLGKALSGMSLTDALSFSDEFDIDLTDLKLEDGKFFIDNTDLLIQRYTEQSQQVLEALKAETEKALKDAGFYNIDEEGQVTLLEFQQFKSFQRLKIGQKKASLTQELKNIQDFRENAYSPLINPLEYTADQFDDFEISALSNRLRDEKGYTEALIKEYQDNSELYNSFDNFLIKKTEILEEELLNLNNEIEKLGSRENDEVEFENLKKEKENLEETSKIITDYTNQIISSIYLSNGRIGDFLNYAKTEILPHLTEEDWTKIQTALRTGDFSDLKEDDLFFALQYSEQYQKTLSNITQTITDTALDLLKNPTTVSGKMRTATIDATNLPTENFALYDALLSEVETGAIELVKNEDGTQAFTIKNAKALSLGTARLLAMQYDTIEEANNFMAAYFTDNTEAYKVEWIKLLSEKSTFSEDDLSKFATSIGKFVEDIKTYFKLEEDGLYRFDEQAGYLEFIDVETYENTIENFSYAARDNALSIIEDIYDENSLPDLNQINDLTQYLKEASVENVDSIIEQVKNGVNSIAEYINLLEQIGIDSDIRLEKEADALEDNLEDNLRTKQFESILSKRAGDKIVVNAISDSLVEFFGSSIQGGILTITSNRDLLASLQSIKDPAELGISTSLEEIAESIQNILNEWNNLLSAGISGSLNEKGVVTLTRDFGLGENSFFRTAKGFGLTESAISSVYTQLKAIDGFAAQISLKALAESAKASDEEFSDIYKTQKKIIKLQEQWAKAEGKRKEELQTQLDIAKEINRSLYSEGNAFNFMNANVPIDITNPLSAWEGVSQAMSVLAGEDFKESRMTYENLRAMVEFIGSKDIKLKGYDQNAFMEAIWDSLSVDAEYGSYVDLERLGEMGFAFSADEMMFAIFEAMDKAATEQEAILQKREDIVAAWKEIQNIGGLNLTEGDKGQIISAEGEDQIIKLFNTYKDLAGTSIEWEAFKEMDGAAKAMREIYEAFLISDEQGYEAYVAFMNKAEAGNSLVDERTQTVQELAKSAEIISKTLSGEVDIDASATLDQLNKIEEKLKELESKGYEINLVYNVSSKQTEEGTYSVTIEDNGTAETLTTLSGALVALQTNANALASAIEGIDDKSTEVSQTASAISSLQSKIITARIDVTVNDTGAVSVSSASFSLSSTQKPAMAKGTLMGELGPELVSANGHYFTVGNNGAEFVDLPSDAIVFNHLQTKKLLESGSISSTGKPITNERKAVAHAKGNVSGPALANANTLKETKGLWRRIQEMSGIFSGFGGDDGNGGGAGGESTAAYIHDLERWYNLLRQIDKLEQQINLRQQERENFTSGYDYVTSLEKELNLLQKQQKVYAQLADLQKDFYDKRRKDLESTDYDKIFTYDEDGLMQYVDGKGRGLDILATLNQANANGAPLLNNKQQVQYLKDQGFDISNFLVKSDGTKIKENDYAGIIENFWSGIDSWMDELDTLYDDYNDHIISIEETLAAQNEILQEYIDNQRAVEDKLFQAIEDREKAEIDRFQKNLDATQEVTFKYLEGLNRAFNKEREMYNRNEEDAETTRLQRQLAILQRSGGSASEIRSLQDQIDSRLQDSYFSEQERQIQAVQEASDLQLEKMQQQLDVMNETLEYQKENGLLWQEVSDMMLNWTPEAMMDFIERFTKSYREDSLLENEEKTKETLKELEIWDAKQQENGRNSLWETYLEGAKTRFDEKAIIEKELDAKAAYFSTLREGKTETDAGAAADEIFNNVKKPQNIDTYNSNEQNNKETVGSSKKTNYYIATYSSLLGTGKRTVGHPTEAEARRAALAAIDADTEAYFLNNPNVPKTSYIGQSIAQWKKTITVKKYAKGGLVDFTGPAWVDGTKAKPEAFLSAEDTALLKSKIFSNSNYSLKSVIEMLESLGRAFSSIDNSSNNREVVFENVEVNIAANTIASDYDARRAGEQVLEELMSIARRNSNIGVARR